MVGAPRPLALAAALLLGACGATSYEDAYRDERLAPDRFYIEVAGNSRTSKGTAMRYLHQRATELCRDAGYDRYVMEDRAEDTRVDTHPAGRSVHTSREHEVSAVVRCAEPRGVAAPGGAGGEQVRTWYCASTAWDETVGGCEPSEVGCEELRSSMLSEGVNLGPCAAVSGVICFEHPGGVTGTRRCHRSQAACEANRSALERAGTGPATRCQPL